MQASAKPVLIIHPVLKQQFPQFVDVLTTPTGKYNPKVAFVHPDIYTDQTPHLSIPSSDMRMSRVVVPGFVSGYHAESQLDGLIKVSHALRFTNPIDKRSPRAREVMLLLSDLEGRGTKPTIHTSGDCMSDVELHYAYYIADLLREVGRVDQVAVMDPHDLVSIKAIRRPYIVLTALRQIATTLKSMRMIPPNSGVVIADDGAIGRSHFFADAADIPIVGRIQKTRRDGAVSIEHIYTTFDQGFKNLTVFLVDDMIATGSTLFKDAQALKNMGAKVVIGIVTHVKGVKDTHARVRSELQSHAGLDQLIVTNTTPYSHQLADIPGVILIDILHILRNAAQSFLSPDFTLTHKSVSGVDVIKEHIFPIDTIDGYKKSLSLKYPMLVPDV